jgi:gliding motility-associated lipoprotein GldH
MKIKLFKKYIPILLSFGLFSCTENVIYQNNIDFESGKWPSEFDADFIIDIADTAATYDLAYTLRNSLDYPYYNLYLQYQIKDSTGNTLDKNLQELILMNPKTGEPLGNGFSKMYDHQFISVREYKFPVQGKYHFKVFHYMRHDTLPEIYSLGLKVIKND